jgi:hypothetical protein
VLFVRHRGPAIAVFRKIGQGRTYRG